VGLLPDVFQVADPIMTPEWYHGVLKNEQQVLFIAQWGGEIVGVVLAKIEDSPKDPILRPRRVVYVDELMVTARLRGQGVGGQLMEEAERWAMKRGIGEVELHVWEANEQAVAFYQRLGYEVVRRRMRRRLEVLS
jgi:ribosomal protein S18 acetylase RimI-like enzyme